MPTRSRVRFFADSCGNIAASFGGTCDGLRTKPEIEWRLRRAGTFELKSYFESDDDGVLAAGFDSDAAGFDSVFVSDLDSDFESVFDSDFESEPLSDLPPSDLLSTLVSPGLPVAPFA
jgi:hypothetical protein